MNEYWTAFAPLVAIVGVATYVHTVTGFAFALVFMSAIAVTGAMGVEEGALIATLLALFNAVQILPSQRHFISTTTFLKVVPLALVGTIAGALLLPFLLAKSVVWLKFILGVAIILSSLRLLRISKNPDAQPGRHVFPLSGLSGGIMGGLFAVPGPPIVYALQRYLPDPRQIRATLVAIFAVIAVARLALTRFWVLPTQSLLLSTLMLVPATIAATEIARRWPPPLSPGAARKLTVLLLLLTGLALVVRAIVESL